MNNRPFSLLKLSLLTLASSLLLPATILAEASPPKNQAPASPPQVKGQGEYAVLMSKATAEDTEWRKIGEDLAARYEGKIILWDKTTQDAFTELKKEAPRYLAVIIKPEEATRELVNDLFRMTRRFNNDPYGDCIWGIITGRTPVDASKVADPSMEPLVLKRAMGTTNYDHKRFQHSFMITDWGPNESVEYKNNGVTDGKKTRPESPEGMAFLFADKWKEVDPQLVITSSHATQYNLEMPFSKGLIASMDGRFHVLRADQLKGFAQFLRGAMFDGSEKDLQNFIRNAKAPLLPVTETPKVWIACGNCLFGNANSSPNSMVVTALSAAGCKQVIGYTVPSWYGKGGWGTLSLFFDNTPDTTLSEAWFLNNQVIIEETLRRYPGLMDVTFDEGELSPKEKAAAQRVQKFYQEIAKRNYDPEKDKDALGLVHDRDTVALYGDPAKVVLLDNEAPAQSQWKCPSEFLVKDNTATLEITADQAKKAAFSFWYPRRMGNEWEAPVLVIEGKEMPIKDIGVATEHFMLLRELDLKAGQKVKIVLKKKAGVS